MISLQDLSKYFGCYAENFIELTYFQDSIEISSSMRVSQTLFLIQTLFHSIPPTSLHRPDSSQTPSLPPSFVLSNADIH